MMNLLRPVLLAGQSPAGTAGVSPAKPWERVLPAVWRWADADGSDRCGTALATADGLVLVDPPAMPDDLRAELTQAAGPVRHVLRTSGGAQEAGGALPGGLIALHYPPDAAPDGEVAYLWPAAGDGLLLTGSLLPVCGQTPVYYEGAAPPVDAYQAALKALLAADPGALAPGYHAPPERTVAYATAYAAHIGKDYHARRAAPVSGPRYLVPHARRALQEALAAPVVLRRPAGAAAGEPWLADPFACVRCGKPHRPMPQTCGGPMIPRLCPDCRQERRQVLPAARVMVCAGGCCTREGARAVLSAAREAAVESGLAQTVDVVPVSCLGECSLGPFVRVSTASGAEPAFAREARERSVERAREYAAQENELIDDESELVLSRFAALVQPADVRRLVAGLADQPQRE